MFNFPLPTDSLYKFSFMFGLLLILFSFYFKDKNLDAYDKRQIIYISDSLSRELKLSQESFRTDSLYLESTSLDINRYAKYKNKSRRNYTFEDLKWEVELAYERVKPKDSILLFKLDWLKKMDTLKIDKKDFATEIAYSIYVLGGQLKLKREKQISEVEFYSNKLLYQQLFYKLILIGGVVLFFAGLIFWYFKIQIIQDKMLNLQLVEIEKKTKGSDLSNRKHFEPQILPWSKFRNRKLPKSS